MGTSLNISMPQELRDAIDEQCARGGFSTPTEYIRQLVRKDLEEARERHLDQLLLEGLKSETTPVTPEDWKEIRKTARARLANRKNR